MIQVNLLPDVKREYLHAQQMKHTFIIGSVLVTLAVLVALGLLFAYVSFVQPRHQANLQTDIDKGIAELKDVEDAIKIVTVQGVLEQIPGVQDKKMITSKLFDRLLAFTPRDVSYNDVQLDLTTNTLTLSGQTTTLERANALANNLKSARFSYKQGEATSEIRPFTAVVFSSLGKSEQSDSANQGVSFKIGFQIDPVLFKQGITEDRITVNATSEELLLPTTSPFNQQPTQPAAQQLMPGVQQ